MVRILFTNTNCSWNKGSAAQVVSTMKILEKFIPNPKFTLLSCYLELDIKHAGKYNLRIVGYPTRKSHKAAQFFYHSTIALFRCLLYKILLNVGIKISAMIEERYLKEYYNTNIVVDLSGDSFSDSKGGKSIINSITLLIALLFRKPIVFFSQSIGPFRKWILRLPKFVLNHADLIIVREEITKHYLESIGIKKGIYLTSDCAFVLEPCAREHVEEMLREENIYKIGRPLVGVSASAMLDDKSGRYVNVMTQIIDYLIEKKGAHVIFVPHNLSSNEGKIDDDRFMSEKIYRLIKNKQKVNLIKGDYTPEELKGLIGLCDVFIGGRMHANIAALSSYIPVIATAWSHKYYGIMRALGQERYVCDLKSITTEDLKGKIAEVWDNRTKIKKALSNKMKTQKQLAWASGQLVRDLLDSLQIISTKETFQRMQN